MGCCSSTKKNGDPVVAEMRRRLTLGFVDQKIATKTADREEDRSLLVELSKQTLLDVINANGRRPSWTVGSETDIDRHRRQSFSQKTVHEMGEKLQVSHGSGTENMGYVCKKGLKPEAPNQDSFFIVRIANEISIYGVFDGHGPAGHDVSDFVKNELPKVLIREPELQSGDPQRALLNSFEKTQRLLEQATEMGKVSAQFSGTTCSVIVHNHTTNLIYVAHVGDSRCVLGRKQEGNINDVASPKTQTAKANHLTGKHENSTIRNVNGFCAVDLTQDHKPDDAIERERIESKGGRVVFDGFYNYRVYAKAGRYPGLNMSRAMGDLAGYYDAGISPVPDVHFLPITRQFEAEPDECNEGVDKFLLLCSDGVWEFMSSQDCINICASFKHNQAQECAEMLAKEAWERWNMHMMGQVVDDITAVVIFL